MEGRKPTSGSTCTRAIASGCSSAISSMSMPPIDGEHHERLLGAAVEDDRRVVLGRDVGGPLDPDLVDGQAPDVHAEDRLGVRLGLVGVLGDLDAAGLAAPADLHLGLDDDRETELLGRRPRLLRRVGMPPLGHGHAVLGEQLLSLVFEQVHVVQPPSFRARAICPPAGRRAGADAINKPERSTCLYPRTSTFVSLEVYGTLIDWETGIYEAFQKEAEQGRLHDRPRSADPAVPRDAAGDHGRLVRAVRGGAAAHGGARRARSSAGSSSRCARASCPTASRRGLRSATRTRCSTGSRRSTRSG